MWHISEDLKRFKAITSGHPVLMGRKTWESLGRALSGRTNVVITRDTDYKAEGAVLAGSLEEAVAMFPPEEEVFVIGGGQIYSQAMQIADRLYLTKVFARYEGDTFFPDIDPALWRMTYEEDFERGENFPYPFQYINYERNK